MMIQKQNQVPSALKLLVVLTSGALAAQARAAESTELVCENSGGCIYRSDNKGWEYSTDDHVWSKSGKDEQQWQKVDADNVRVRLQPKHYENAPAPHSGYVRSLPDDTRPNQYDRKKNVVVGIRGDKDKRGELTIPKGASLTLSEDFQDSALINVNSANATLEKGVTLTVNPSYAEKHNINVKDFIEWDDLEAGIAIEVDSYGSFNSTTHSWDEAVPTHVKTSADIVLNGAGSAGIEIFGEKNAVTVEASHHNITLNASYSAGLVNLNQGGKIHADSVKIVSGSGAVENVALVGENIRFDNGVIDLNPQHLSAGISFNENKLPLEIHNSTVNARYGLITVPDDDSDPENAQFNFHHSNISGTAALLVVNPKEISDEEIRRTPGSLHGNVTLNAHHSHLYGKIELNRQKADAPQSRNLALNLRDNSTWTLNGNSELDNLNVAGSQVVFEKGNAFKTLTLHGDLSGNGTFALHTDIAAGQGDKLQVKGKVSGSHVLQIEDSQNEPKSEQQALTVVESGGGDGTFKLSGDYVDAGTFRYRLSKQGGNWALTYATRREKPQVTDSKNVGTSLPVGNVPDTPVPPPAPNHNTTAAPPPVPNNNATAVPAAPDNVLPEPRILSAYAGQSLAHIQAAVQNLQQQHDTLNLRLADLHSAGYLNGFWMEGENGETHTHGRAVGNHAHSSSFRQVRNAYQIGYDRRLANGYLGVLAGRSRSNLHYRDGLYADSSLKTDTFAVYGGVSSDDWFADGVWRHNRYKANGAAGIDRFRSDSLTVQGGRNIPLSEHWYITPQATLTAAYVSGGRYTDKSLLLQSRAGADLNGWFPVGQGVLKPSFGVHYVGDHRRAGMTFNGNSFSVPRSGSRVAVRGGLAMDFGTYNSLNINLQTEYGKHMRRPYTIGIGYRRTW